MLTSDALWSHAFDAGEVRDVLNSRRDDAFRSAFIHDACKARHVRNAQSLSLIES